MAEPRLIVFDCDGTLVDSQLLIVDAMRQAFQGAGLRAPERAQILRTVGLSVFEAMASLVPHESPETLQKLTTTYREWCFTLRQQPGMQEPLFEGAAALIHDLAIRADIILGIATGKSRRGVARMLGSAGLEGAFATIQTADDAPSKPHPAMLLQAMAETGVSPAQTVMIGDTAYDMQMAASAGVSAIGVAWGYHKQAELKKAGAAFVARSFAELALLLGMPPHAPSQSQSQPSVLVAAG
jgi:phosphoglycolate phosphatase